MSHTPLASAASASSPTSTNASGNEAPPVRLVRAGVPAAGLLGRVARDAPGCDGFVDGSGADDGARAVFGLREGWQAPTAGAPYRDALQLAERLRAGDPVDMQAVRCLKAAHRALGQRSVATIDRSRVEPVAAKLPLEPADLAGPGAGIARARIQHRRRAALRASAVRRCRPRADHAPSGTSRRRSRSSGRNAHRRPRREYPCAVEATLQRADDARVRPAVVAASGCQHDRVGGIRLPAGLRVSAPTQASAWAGSAAMTIIARRHQYGGVFRGRDCTGQGARSAAQPTVEPASLPGDVDRCATPPDLSQRQTRA